MALSGSQKAYLQARSGIARSGATRSGYYLGDAVITIDHDGAPVDVSQYIVHNGWSVSLNLNDDIDTAAIALLPSCPFVPLTRSQIKIGLGAASNPLFGGIVLTVQRTRRPGPDPRFWYDLTCVDWTALLDAHFVVAAYPAQSVTTTILDLIARFTRANISTAGVAPGLPTIEGFEVVNERPSTVLRRITNKIGGGFYLDANRVLRAWSSAIPSPLQDPIPQPLTDHLSTLKTFRMTEDASQQRTRVWAEGQRTATVLGVPAWHYATMGHLRVPVSEGHVLPLPPAITPDNFVRLGTVLGSGPDDGSYPTPADVQNPEGAVMLNAAEPVGDTTAVLTFASTSMFGDEGWCEAAGQLLLYYKMSGTELAVPRVPTAGGDYGALRAPLAVGTLVVPLPWVRQSSLDRTAASPATPPLVSVDTRPQPQDAPIVLVVMREDAAAAATIAAREGSDGYLEHLVQDGRWNAAGARARALAELADFAQPTLVYEWDTDDLNAAPGVMQHIALAEGTPVTADVRITNVDVQPIATNHPPRRQVRATKLQPAGVVDIWVDDER